jgi:hypothetical protein
MPILYDCSTAPSPRRARILLAEKGVAHETVQIDLRSGELLWDGSATASSAEQSSGNQAGLIGLLVQAVVAQIIDNVSERSHPIAGIASQRLLGTGRANGLLPGPRAPVKAP